MKDTEILQHVINGVKIEILNYKCDYVGIQYAKTNGYYFLNNELYITYDGGYTGKSLKDCRFILTPLSELNKNKYKDIVFPKKDYCGENISYHRNLDIAAVQMQEYTSQSVTFFVIVQRLIKLHFDIFGLIEKGLAIDINTLKQ